MHIHNDAFWRQESDTDSAPATTSSGGLPLYLNCLCDAQRRRGIGVSMIRFTPKKPERAMDDKHCHVLQTASQRPRPAAHRRLYHCVREETPDVIHMHSTYYAMNPIMLRGLRRMKPVVHTFHDVMPLCFRHNKLHPDGQLCQRAVGYRCVTSGCYRVGTNDALRRDAVRVLISPLRLNEYRRLPLSIVPSRYLCDQLVINGFCAERIRVLPLFSRFEGNGCMPTKTAPSSLLRILFVGRLVADKGLPELIEALALLRDKRWHATIVGDGALSEPLRQAVRDQGLSQRIDFAGNAATAALQKHYESCSFVVFPSLVPEAFGLVGVEAMTFGKPIVAFGSGGVNDWLENGVNGLMAARGDVQDLARQMARFIDEPDLRRRLGCAGYDMVRTRFTQERHHDALLEIYTQLIAATSGAH